jgi:hydrogenase expression/formation protein HypE
MTAAPALVRSQGPRLAGKTVTLAHGGGGSAMRDLVDEVFLQAFGSAAAPPEDQARLAMSRLAAQGDRLAFTTDSFVVDPLFFPGGDIGKLAVCGTINDLAVGGARPVALSCAVIIEEGLPVDTLLAVAASMARAAAEAGVTIATGDTKVVARGACDKLFVTTTGIGVVPAGLDVGIGRARAGDMVLVNGFLGDHGAAILGARGDLALESTIESDCASLHGLVADLVAAAPDVRTMRDATRGGVAAVLNELAEASRISVALREVDLPLRAEVKGFCEILGLDPLYLANEGKLVAVVPPDQAADALAAMQRHPLGQHAAIIGSIGGDRPGCVVMESVLGGRRFVDMPVGDQLPRIC